MQETINDLLTILSQYFVYIYPGLISYYLFRFIKSHNVEENKNTIIKILSISFIYVKIVQMIFRVTDVKQLLPIHQIVLIIVALICPLIWNVFIHSKKLFPGVMRFFNN